MSRTQIIDGRDEGGNTDLMRAALNGQNETVKALLLSGADPKTICRPARTALVVAKERGHTAIVELIKRALDQRVNGKTKRVRSNVKSFTRDRALATTK